MRFKRLLAVTCMLLFCGPAFAGAWDTGPFDNDDALDWVWELTDSTDLSVLNRALDDVVRSPGYIDAPYASMALAAAEVLAAIRGNPRDGLPDEVADWVSRYDLTPPDGMTEKAQRAIELILDTNISELAQLWGDSPELASAWRKDLEGLLHRLQ